MGEVVGLGNLPGPPAGARSEPESYADYPVSLVEERSNRADSQTMMTPRAVLIELLREIDQGMEYAGIVILTTRVDPDGPRFDRLTTFRSAGLRTSEALSVMEIEKYRLLKRCVDPED